MRQIPFKSSDTGPKRAQQLIELSGHICDHEQRIGLIEQDMGNISPPGTPGDPGDLTLWFENKLV